MLLTKFLYRKSYFIFEIDVRNKLYWTDKDQN
jgi:hypothetical protein